MSTETDIVVELEQQARNRTANLGMSDAWKYSVEYRAIQEITALRDALRPFVTACTLGTEGAKVINKKYHGLNPISVVVTKFQYLAARKVMGSAMVATKREGDAT